MYVYDWKARLLEVLRFEYPISSIAYANGVLYGIEWREGLPSVKRWKVELPQAMAACPPWDPTFPTRFATASAPRRNRD